MTSTHSDTTHSSGVTYTSVNESVALSGSSDSIDTTSLNSGSHSVSISNIGLTDSWVVDNGLNYSSDKMSVKGGSGVLPKLNNLINNVRANRASLSNGFTPVSSDFKPTPSSVEETFLKASDGTIGPYYKHGPAYVTNKVSHSNSTGVSIPGSNTTVTNTIEVINNNISEVPEWNSNVMNYSLLGIPRWCVSLDVSEPKGNYQTFNPGNAVSYWTYTQASASTVSRNDAGSKKKDIVIMSTTDKLDRTPILEATGVTHDSLDTNSGEPLKLDTIIKTLKRVTSSSTARPNVNLHTYTGTVGHSNHAVHGSHSAHGSHSN